MVITEADKELHCLLLEGEAMLPLRDASAALRFMLLSFAVFGFVDKIISRFRTRVFNMI